MRVIKFDPTYKLENGLEVIYLKSLPIPKGFTILPSESGIVSFPPGAIGGNHKHPRREIFYSTGDLKISWLDENNKKHVESMAPENNGYKLYLTEPNEIHAIVNNSREKQIMVEFAAEPQRDVEKISLV